MGLKYLKNGLGIENLKDGHYHFMIDRIDKEEGVVYAIRNLNVSFNEARRKNWIIKVPLEELRKIWFGELNITIAGFHIYVSDNGKNVKYEQGLGRRGRMRKRRAKVMAQILSEEYGSVDAFMEANNLTFEPGSIQEQIYRQLKSGQIEFTKDLEKKLMVG